MPSVGEVFVTLRLEDLIVTPPAGGGQWRASVTVPAGKLVGVRAMAEAGTALARTVVGLAPPVSGSVWLGNRDVTATPPADRRIGYLPAGGGLLPHLTVRENIRYGLRHREVVRELANEVVETVITQLELAPTLHLRPHLLSGSQRLRVALARTVACLPEVLVLDLPGGALLRPRDLLARVDSPAALVITADEELLDDADQIVELA